MNANRHTDADEQASLWAARLEGSVLSADDRAALDAWLAADPAHRPLLSQYCQFSADLELTLPALVESGLVAMPAAPQPARRTWLPKLLAGSALAAAAAVAVALWVGTPSRPQAQEFATTARHATFTLADGTQVDLNAHTRLRVAFARGERRVQLSDGEAFFSVTKDKTRPFFVDSPAGSVRVTGTQFDVRSDGAPHFEVVVAEGSVQARPSAAAGGSAAPVQLGVGDRLSAVAGTVQVQSLSTRALADTLAWRQSQVVFDRVPLREAVERFARYHQREIIVADSIAGLMVGGRFSLDDLDGFFTALEQIHPVTVIRSAQGPIKINPRTAQ